MSDPIRELCNVLLKIAQTSADLDLVSVVAQVQAELDRNGELAQALQTDTRMLQINLGQSKGYQVLVEANATAYIGDQYHFDSEAVIKALGQLLDQIALPQRPVSSSNNLTATLSQKWFQDRLDEAVANAGPRYSPEFNVELPVVKLFDGLGRTKVFFDQFKILREKINKSFLDFIRSETKLKNKIEIKSTKNNIIHVLEILEKMEVTDIVSPINFNEIIELIFILQKQIHECDNALRLLGKEEKKNQLNPESSFDYGENYSSEIHYLYEIRRTLSLIQEIINHSGSKLVNVGALLLLGDAGTGKSHLFCDVAKSRLEVDLPTILLLGEQFNNTEPWSQIIGLLGLSCTKEEFLSALDSIALAHRSKVLIFIDALNEGEGKKLWKKHLAGMLTTLSRFPRLGIAISVRTPYEDLVIPEEVYSDRLVKEIHYGFADHEYQATRIFFDHFDIKRPSIPPLNPEFQNPLFLRLFCIGLKNNGMTEVPTGFQGITTIFKFLIDSVNIKLAQEEFLNFDKRLKIVQKAMQKFSEKMAESDRQWLTHEEAQDTINSFLPHNGYHDSLLRHLLVEGLLAEDRFRQENNENVEGIRFSYERFADHLILKYLLDKYLDSENPSYSFSQDKPLGSLIKNRESCYKNYGLLEALCIQLPERIHKEVAEVAPYCSDYGPIREGFIKSLIWRDPASISDATRQYINEQIIQDNYCREQLMNVLLTVSSNPDHPFNADFLHRHLKKIELAKRDAWWSAFLHYEYGEHKAIDRLVDWAWSEEDKTHINDESIRLCATALAWFLTTSNRFLRDQSTKALVALLTPRINVLRQLLSQFIDINDTYILERLFAVSYGCAMRNNSDNSELAKLAKDIYQLIFEKGEPIPHLLLRDYARGVIEFALSRQIDLDIDVERIRPPYKGEWLKYLPSEEDLANFFKKEDENSESNDRRYSAIRYSVLGWGDTMLGDFAQYEIKHNIYQWSSQNLSESRSPSPQEKYENFLESLTLRQKKALKAYEDLKEVCSRYLKLNLEEKLKISEYELTDQELEKCICQSKQSLFHALGKRKTAIFAEFVIPYLNSPNAIDNLFDLSMALRWIFWKVCDLGWTPELFDEFDSMVNYSHRDGRSAQKAERIGKKYQWLAFHEFLARVADNFEFKGDFGNESDEKGYQGPWQVSLRDIDPSCLLRSTLQVDSDSQAQPWWVSSQYDQWDSAVSHLEWLKEESNLPSVESLIKVVNPKDNSQWLALESYKSWYEPSAIEIDSYKKARRKVEYLLQSYIVHKEDIDCLYNWACHQDFMGRWMPESSELWTIFLGEYFWSPAFRYHDIPYFSNSGWTRGSQQIIPRKLLVSTYKYLKENSTYDCSIDSTYSIYLPCNLIVEKMNLNWQGNEGSFYDKQNKLVAFDPSLQEPGSNSCLIKYDSFLNFLNENKYDILWILLGEKNILNNDSTFHGRLELSGAFRIIDGAPTGKLNSKLRLPDRS